MVGLLHVRAVKGRNIFMEVKRDLRNTILLPTITYGWEKWTWNRVHQSRVRAVEMNYLRVTCSVTRWEGENNSVIYETYGMRFLGHVMRRNEMEAVVLTGVVEGRRAGGRQREKYMDGVTRAAGGDLKPVQFLQMTRDQVKWLSMVAEVQVDGARR